MHQVSERRAAAIAWSACGLAMVLAAATAVFAFVDDGTRLPADEGGQVTASGELTFAVMIMAFAALGAVIASRRPRNPIGWILCVAPVALAFTGVARGLYVHSYFADPGSLDVPDALVWAANWAWVPGFMPLPTLLLLLFPDGQPVSRRWRPVAWAALLAMSMLVVGYALAPGPLEDYPRVENPLGVEGGITELFDLFLELGFPLFALSMVASMASMAVRFRRSRGEQRQQLKWVAAAAALVVAAWLVNAVLDQGFGINSAFVLPIALLTLPGAAAVAVLRYRLYDLELVVNRTLVYGVLSATLVGSYLGLVFLFQAVLSPLTQQSDLAIAGSTLAVAALFRPARRRIQELVDRRFYRRKYDATRTIEAFSARLRDEVELDLLSTGLRDVARETMQPAHVSVWLRPQAWG